jgi:hypothetical protein
LIEGHQICALKFHEQPWERPTCESIPFWRGKAELLSVLVVMHIYWFYLFFLILVRVVTNSSTDKGKAYETDLDANGENQTGSKDQVSICFLFLLFGLPLSAFPKSNSKISLETRKTRNGSSDCCEGRGFDPFVYQSWTDAIVHVGFEKTFLADRFTAILDVSTEFLTNFSLRFSANRPHIWHKSEVSKCHKLCKKCFSPFREVE